MWEWLVNNLSTILVGLGVLALLVGVIVYMIRQKRRGETSCGCGCTNCAMRGTCHAANQENNEE